MPRTDAVFPERELEALAQWHEEAGAMWARSQPHGRLAEKSYRRAAAIREGIAAYREACGLPPRVVFRPLPSPAGSGDANEQ